MRPRVAIVTNALPTYRRGFVRGLIAALGTDLTIYCQDRVAGMNLELIHAEFPANVRTVRAWDAPRQRIGWQWLPFVELMRNYDVYVFTGAPRILSTLLFATLLRLMGRPVVLWGQAHSAGASQPLERLRLAWWRRFAFILVYTEREAEELREKGFRSQYILAANNGLDQDVIDEAARPWDAAALERWRSEQGLAGRAMILSCARLDPKNRFGEALDALRAVVARRSEVLWCVIGDGPERAALERRARDLALQEHVRWLGAIYDEGALAPWFLSSRALVHPAGIGLSLLHAYGYGLPVITHDNPRAHNPEFAALSPLNAVLCFPQGDPRILAERIESVLFDSERLQAMRYEVREVARHRYNTATMVARARQMIEAAAPAGRSAESGRRTALR
jgi:glycosyltransferase involved in cell wall biosynthesis